MAKDREHRLCPPSEAKYLNSFIRAWFERPKRLMRKYVNPGDVVADLGCGGGIFSIHAARRVGENGLVIAVDVQKEMLKMTLDLSRKKGVEARVSLMYAQSDDLFLSPETIDVVLAIYVVHETPDPEQFLQQAAGLLKPNGRLILLEPRGHVKNSLYKLEVDTLTTVGLRQVKSLTDLARYGGVFEYSSEGRKRRN